MNTNTRVRSSTSQTVTSGTRRSVQSGLRLACVYWPHVTDMQHFTLNPSYYAVCVTPGIRDIQHGHSRFALGSPQCGPAREATSSARRKHNRSPVGPLSSARRTPVRRKVNPTLVVLPICTHTVRLSPVISRWWTFN